MANVTHTVIEWARRLGSENHIVIDTETTGFDHNARIVSIGIVDQAGKVLLNTLLNPEAPIPEDATRVHGITDDMVAQAPTFLQMHARLNALISNRVVVAYNAKFDMRMLGQECNRVKLNHFAPLRIDCAMLKYAAFAGVWDSYRKSYKWHSLSSATKSMGIEIKEAHSAAGDAMATHELIRKLAALKIVE